MTLVAARDLASRFIRVVTIAPGQMLNGETIRLDGAVRMAPR